MAMSLGSNGRLNAAINMTPMIDVLLVLIIIFLVITPVTSTGLNALVPQPPDESKAATPAVNDDIVVTVNGDHTVMLNQEPVTVAELPARLRNVFRNHLNHVLFVKGTKGLEFAPVAEVIDIARGVGLDRVALISR